jgi:hypothetical protein
LNRKERKEHKEIKSRQWPLGGNSRHRQMQISHEFQTGLKTLIFFGATRKGLIAPGDGDG